MRKRGNAETQNGAGPALIPPPSPPGSTPPSARGDGGAAVQIGQLFPQEGDIHLHIVVLRLGVQAPDLRDDGLLGHHGPGVDHEQAEHLELLEAQAHGALPLGQKAGGAVQLQLPGGEHVAEDLPLPPGEGPHPGHQLAGVKGLGHIVVRSAVQAVDLVADLVPGGEHQNGGGHVGGPQPLGRLKAVHLGEHHVQNDQIILARQAVVHSVRPVVHRVRLVPLVLQQLLQGLRQPDLVLHDQNTHGRASCQLICPLLYGVKLKSV